MTVNKKLFSIFILSVVTPLVLASINNYLADNQYSEFSYGNGWVIATIMYMVSLVGSVFVIVKANESDYKTVWTSVGIIGILVFGVLAYLTYSFSHFGF